jgi:chitodextrinase
MRAVKPCICLLIALSLASSASAQTPGPYQDLYSQLDGDINDFQRSITGAWNGSKFPVKFAGQLTDANCNTGPALLQPSSFTLIQSEILLLKAMGVKAVSVEVSYPMLDPAFFNSIGQPSYQSQFTTFYANVASAIRAQGLGVIVESQSMIPTGLQSKWGSGLQNYYASITTFQAYQQARAQTAAIVAQTMQPDYFVLQEEPDTEDAQSTQTSAGTVSGSTSMLNGTLAAVRQVNIPGMKVGAGFGTWLQEYQLFANSFTRQHCGQLVSGQIQPCISQPLDFLDMHIFPVNEHTVFCSPPPNPKPCTAPNFWQNAMTTLSTANAANLPMTISQTWLRKTRDGEWLQINGDIDEAREAYTFWEPLDLSFLQTIYDLANYGHMSFVVPFNTQSYSAYLTWTGGASTCTVSTMPVCTALQGEGGGNTPQQVFGNVQSAGLTNVAAASYTSVATGFHDLIVADAMAPSNPTSVVALRTSPATVTLSWTASTDDVGVAGYHIRRNGMPLRDIFQSPFQDTGLTASTVYTYTVQAFDLAGNVSAQTSSSPQTPRRRAATH